MKSTSPARKSSITPKLILLLFLSTMSVPTTGCDAAAMGAIIEMLPAITQTVATVATAIADATNDDDMGDDPAADNQDNDEDLDDPAADDQDDDLVSESDDDGIEIADEDTLGQDTDPFGDDDGGGLPSEDGAA